MSKRENYMNMDSPDQQLTEKLQKLRAFQESLKGKARLLEKKEAELKEKELRVYGYRAQLLEALRQMLLEDPRVNENQALMDKYDEILSFLVTDVKDDVDDIMG